MSTALELFHALRVIYTAVEGYRADLAPAGDEWLKVSDILGRLDDAMTMLVRSRGWDDAPGPGGLPDPR